MRVLCTVAFSAAHARATLPLVSMLTSLGHEVLVAGPDSVLAGFAGEPVRTAGVLPEVCDQLADLLQGEVLALPPDYDPFADEMIVEFAAGPHITNAARALLPVASDFRPHLVLRGGIEFAGLLVAERLGVPHVAAPSGVGPYLDRVTLLNALNERRAELRLPLHESLDSAHRYGRLDAVPPGYSFARQPMPAAFAFQQPSHHSAGERLPQWVADLDPSRPLVVASTSTSGGVFATESALRLFDFDALPDQALRHSPLAHLETVVAGLSSVDCEAVVLTGGLPVQDSGAANVHLAETLPQALLLQAADLLVSHGGYNSIREAMRAGVPVAVLPVLHDQMHNAHRVGELGLGVRVQDFEADAVASACRYALTNAAVRQGVRKAQRHMLGLPSIREVAGYLERIVQRNRRLVSM
ncbi:glycosyltransferase [Lentzea sp. BCCO 10_0856]|uniref:Glycosyltransferase n=1 Tax=Lentzea miocenica TaxID=3095431 RepID=A0ABU4SXU7_9PSEU|nr:nucleotide disphospho-sugar-binding domain-containing protein [Lentzea sp. BCCO 10_0856]MDX8030739.1 glycosyltransferase [Lentzea sp. BCCO 10_0856]